MQTGVLDMVRSDRLLSFDLHTYVHPDGSWHSGLISSLVCQMKVRYTCLLSWLKSVPSTKDKCFNYLLLVLLSLCDSLLLSSVSNSIGFSLISKTHPGCTKRPSPRSESGLRWWFDPGSHRSHVWTSVSHATWCRRPRPTRGPWYGQTSCGIHWRRQRQKLLAEEADNCDAEEQIVMVEETRENTFISKFHVVLWWSKNINNGVSQMK